MLMHNLLYWHHYTVQCDASEFSESLTILPELCLHSGEQNRFCLSVGLCPPLQITYISVCGSVAADLYQYSTLHELQYQYIVRNSDLGGPLVVESHVNLVISTLV
jgi:hypothetical protein